MLLAGATGAASSSWVGGGVRLGVAIGGVVSASLVVFLRFLFSAIFSLHRAM